MFDPSYVLWFLVSPSLCLVLVMFCGFLVSPSLCWFLLCVVVLGVSSLCLVLFMCCGSLCPLNCVSCFLLCVVVLGVP